MAQKNLLVDEPIELGYQAPNKESGLSGIDAPIAEIYLPGTKEKDSNYPDVELIEVESTGTYRGEFTPDSQGDWQVIMHKADGDGQTTKKYSVGAHNVHSVGEKANSIQTAVAALPDAGEVNTIVDTRVDVTDAKIDALDTKVSELDTPPMAF